MKRFKILLTLVFIFNSHFFFTQEWAVVPRVNEGTIVIVDIETIEVIDEFETIGGPIDVAWTNDCMKLYVSPQADGVEIFEFDGESYDPVGVLEKSSRGLMVSPDNELWVTNPDSYVRIHMR